MSQLPKGWVEAGLEDVAAFNPGHTASASLDLSVSFVPMPAVSEFAGEIVSSIVRPFREVSKSYTQFQEGDVIFAKITPCMENGKIAVARSLENGVACGSTEFHVLRPQGGISADYLWRFLRQKSFRKDAEASMTGAVGQRRVPASFLKLTRLPLPPRPEQQRIVAKIDSLSAKSARARDHLDHVPRLVEKYKQSILAAAFRGDLTREWRLSHGGHEAAPDYLSKRQREHTFRQTEPSRGRDEKAAQLRLDREIEEQFAILNQTAPLPATWCWANIGLIFGVYVGATPSRKDSRFWNGKIRWVSSGEVAFCRIRETSETITDLGLQKTSTRLHPPGTLLIGMIGEGKTRGQVAILDAEATNNQNCAAIRVSEAGYDVDYVYWYLWMSYAQNRAIGSGNNQKALNKERVQHLRLPLAPPVEAGEIASCINELFSWIDRLAKEATSARKLVDRLDQSVLAKAFQGKLVPQNPNDEPVSVLLERIRAERETGTNSGRGRRYRTA